MPLVPIDGIPNPELGAVELDEVVARPVHRRRTEQAGCPPTMCKHAGLASPAPRGVAAKATARVHAPQPSSTERRVIAPSHQNPVIGNDTRASGAAPTAAITGTKCS